MLRLAMKAHNISAYIIPATDAHLVLKLFYVSFTLSSSPHLSLAPFLFLIYPLLYVLINSLWFFYTE